MIEHLAGRQDQPREAQVSAMHLGDVKGWILAPPLPRLHLRVGRGGKCILLEISVYLRPSEGELLLTFISMSVAAAFGLFLFCCSQGVCNLAVIAVLSIML